MAQNFYCEYCGAKYSSISSLTNGYCPRHPNGTNKGKQIKENINFMREEKSRNISVSIAELKTNLYNH